MGMSLAQVEYSAHVGHLVLGLPMGGTEGLVDKLLRRPPAGFSSSAICLDEIGVLGETAVQDGFQVCLLPRGAGINWALPAAIARHARRHSIRILHCHHYTPWFYGVLARLFHRKLKIVFTEHGRLYPDLPSGKRRIFNRLMYPFTDCITAVSPAVAEALNQIEGFPAGRIRIIFNGVDSSRFTSLPNRRDLRARFGLREDFIYFVLCARLDPIKWIDGLLQALRKVVDANRQAGLLLVGDGSEKQKIQSMVKDLGLTEHVVMPGYRKNIPEWLAAADVFVLSSHSEGTSVSLIESMAAGLPSVATRVGGNKHVIEDNQTGFLVPPQNADSLAEAMLRLVDNPDLRHQLGSNALNRFRSHFVLDQMLANYEAVYRSLITD
jgi:L-malate glycosyltransferase